MTSLTQFARREWHLRLGHMNGLLTDRCQKTERTRGRYHVHLKRSDRFYCRRCTAGGPVSDRPYRGGRMRSGRRAMACWNCRVLSQKKSAPEIFAAARADGSTMFVSTISMARAPALVGPNKTSIPLPTRRRNSNSTTEGARRRISVSASRASPLLPTDLRTRHERAGGRDYLSFVIRSIGAARLVCTP